MKRRRALCPESGQAGQAVSILLEGGGAWSGWWEKQARAWWGFRKTLLRGGLEHGWGAVALKPECLRDPVKYRSPRSTLDFLPH